MAHEKSMSAEDLLGRWWNVYGPGATGGLAGSLLPGDAGPFETEPEASSAARARSERYRPDINVLPGIPTFIPAPPKLFPTGPRDKRLFQGGMFVPGPLFRSNTPVLQPEELSPWRPQGPQEAGLEPSALLMALLSFLGGQNASR